MSLGLRQNFGFPDIFIESMKVHEGRHRDIYSVKLPMIYIRFFALEDRDNAKLHTLVRETTRNVGSGDSDRG